MRIFGHEFPGYQEERADLREARRELEEYSAGLTEETDEYLSLNHNVIEAEQAVPWYLR